MRSCVDCGASVTGHGKAVRCQSCAARLRYIKKHGKPPEKLVAKCEVCRLQFEDYATNHKKSKHGVYFCSTVCRAAWTGVHNSVSRGGDGRKVSKRDKDASHYRKNSDKIRSNASSYYKENRESILARLKDRGRAAKAEVISAYGGKCECCGETHHEFLTIDHTDGSGAEHRRQVGKGRSIYADLKRQGFPKDCYRLMCLNCNISLVFYGYCPHHPEIRRQVDKRPKKPGRKKSVK